MMKLLLLLSSKIKMMTQKVTLPRKTSDLINESLKRFDFKIILIMELIIKRNVIMIT